MKSLRQFSIYTLVGFIGAGVNFFLMPYLTHFLHTWEYGVLSMVNSFVTILIPLVGLSVAGYANVEYYKLRNKDRKEFASVFSTVQLIPVLPFIFILLLTILLAHPIAVFLEIPTAQSYWIPLSTLLAVLTIYYETLIGFNIIEQKPGTYTFFVLVKLAIEVSLTIYFITVLDYGWEGRLLAWVIASAVLFIASFAYFNKLGLLTRKIKKKYRLAALSFGLPLILHVIGKFVINYSDRVFITKMVSIDEAGIYNIGYQVGMLILLFVTAVSNFISPYIFERLADISKEKEIQLVRTSYIIIVGLLLTLLCLTILAPLFFKYMVDPSYAEGVRYVFWTGLSYFFWGVYIIFTGFIFYYKKTKVLGYLAIVNVILNIGLNYLLILRFGAIGAVYATCISFFVVMLVVIWQSNKLIQLPWFDFKAILKTSG
ncbi:MAG: oligosaccharide flippase family protein [Bacteroidetes bacterium]|nr:oligosaccharide flippase family protein [Bacteroidota bacterium]